MTTAQKRAIWYAQKERKIKKLQELGLYEEYKEFNKGKKCDTIEVFCRKKKVNI